MKWNEIACKRFSRSPCNVTVAALDINNSGKALLRKASVFLIFLQLKKSNGPVTYFEQHPHHIVWNVFLRFFEKNFDQPFFVCVKELIALLTLNNKEPLIFNSAKWRSEESEYCKKNFKNISDFVLFSKKWKIQLLMLPKVSRQNTKRTEQSMLMQRSVLFL